MWNFIKNLYYSVRNAVALAYTKVVGYSMRLANKANAMARANKGASVKSFLTHMASFAVYCVAIIGFKLMVGFVLGALATLFGIFLGGTIGMLLAFLLTVAFIIDVCEAISFVEKINRILRESFHSEVVDA